MAFSILPPISGMVTRIEISVTHSLPSPASTSVDAPLISPGTPGMVALTEPVRSGFQVSVRSTTRSPLSRVRTAEGRCSAASPWRSRYVTTPACSERSTTEAFVPPRAWSRSSRYAGSTMAACTVAAGAANRARCSIRLGMNRRLPLTPVTTSRPASDVRLSGYTTLRLGGPAARFVEARSALEVVDGVRAADAAGEPLLVLGGGSNVLVADKGFDGTVVHVANKGIGMDSTSAGQVQLTAEAGESWDAVVEQTVKAGLGGLECLSGIPGLVGATPVQNVGAYGVEVSEVLVSVDLLDRASGEVRTLTADQLGLAYRTSVLKGTDRAVGLRVRFQLADT